MLDPGDGALQRIAQQQDQLCLRRGAGQAHGHLRVVEVVGGGFTAQDAAASGKHRELGCVPAGALLPGAIEKVQFLAGMAADLGVVAQPMQQRGGAAFGHADDHEIRRAGFGFRRGQPGCLGRAELQPGGQPRAADRIALALQPQLHIRQEVQGHGIAGAGLAVALVFRGHQRQQCRPKTRELQGVVDPGVLGRLA